jgi:hypothetical protein
MRTKWPINDMGRFIVVMIGFQQGTDFFTRNDDTHNGMPVGLIIFGDKSHTNLHGSLALTPIIFTLTFFNRISQNNTHFWRLLAYFLILVMVRIRPTRQIQGIIFRTNTLVCQQHSNHSEKFIGMGDFKQL